MHKCASRACLVEDNRDATLEQRGQVKTRQSRNTLEPQPSQSPAYLLPNQLSLRPPLALTSLLVSRATAVPNLTTHEPHLKEKGRLVFAVSRPNAGYNRHLGDSLLLHRRDDVGRAFAREMRGREGERWSDKAADMLCVERESVA